MWEITITTGKEDGCPFHLLFPLDILNMLMLLRVSQDIVLSKRLAIGCNLAVSHFSLAEIGTLCTAP